MSEVSCLMIGGLVGIAVMAVVTAGKGKDDERDF